MNWSDQPYFAALDWAREHHDAVVLDVLLPGMDGFRVLRSLRDEAKSQHLAIVTFEPHPLTVLRPELAPPRLTPPELKRALPTPKLPDAPRVETTLETKPMPIEVAVSKPAPRAFVPPADTRMARQAALLLPDAPAARDVVVEPNALPFAPAASRPRPL